MVSKTLKLKAGKNIIKNIELPASFEEFKHKYISALQKSGLDPRKTLLFGGCIRDMILGGEIKDYDMISGYPRKTLARALSRAGIKYSNGTSKDLSHVYVELEGALLQIGEDMQKKPDFSINGFKCNIIDLEIELCEECQKDIIQNRLRLVEKNDDKCLRRGIYMYYKYSFLVFTKETIEKLSKIEPNEANTMAFIKRKGIPAKDFYMIAKKWELHKNLKFVKGYIKETLEVPKEEVKEELKEELKEDIKEVSRENSTYSLNNIIPIDYSFIFTNPYFFLMNKKI